MQTLQILMRPNSKSTLENQGWNEHQREKTYVFKSVFAVPVKKFASLTIQNALSEDSDQTARMRSLIWIFAGRPCPKVRFLTLSLKMGMAFCLRHQARNL